MSGIRGRHRRVDLRPAAAVGTAAEPGRIPTPGEREAQALLRRFPPRSPATIWPATQQTREHLLDRLLTPPFDPGKYDYRLRIGLDGVLEWLAGQPGRTWQQRWHASGAEAAGNVGWRDVALSWLRSEGSGYSDSRYWDLGSAVRRLLCGDVIRPSLAWMTTPATIRCLPREMARTRDPDAFTQLTALIDADEGAAAMKASALTKMQVLCRIATIMVAKGGLVRDITVGDCLELISVIGGPGKRNSMHFYQALHGLGVFPADAPATVRTFYTQAGSAPSS